MNQQISGIFMTQFDWAECRTADVKTPAGVHQVVSPDHSPTQLWNWWIN